MIQVRWNWLAMVAVTMATLTGCAGRAPVEGPSPETVGSPLLGGIHQAAVEPDDEPGEVATTAAPAKAAVTDSAGAKSVATTTGKPTNLAVERDSTARGRGRNRSRLRRPEKKRLEITKAVADSIFPLAEAHFRAGRYASAQIDFEKLTNFIRTGDPRFGRLHFLLGEAYLGQENHLQAARELRRVSDESGDEDLAPSALLRVADSYAEMWRRPELDPSFANTAIATYQELQSRYPGTPAALTGQGRISALQDKLAYKSLKSGLYYFRLKAWDSAIIYFKDLVATYPRTTSAPLALVRLVQAYRIIGYQEDIKETCGYMRRFHAAAPGVADVCKGVPEA